MTIGELREILADLPDDMHVAVRGYENGFDPLMTVMVRRLAPDRSPRGYDGILTDEAAERVASRKFLALGTPTCIDVQQRFDAAGIDGHFDNDADAWSVSGWIESDLTLFSVDYDKAS